MKILQGVRIFAEEQMLLGEDSVFYKLKTKEVKKGVQEQIQDVLKAFKAFCLPSFLIKGDIYQKMFHEKMT
jgi:hypothetical protein